MINHLCNRGIIETNEKIQAEGLRRISRRQEIDNKIRIKHLKARVRAKIEEKKNAEQ